MEGLRETPGEGNQQFGSGADVDPVDQHHRSEPSPDGALCYNGRVRESSYEEKRGYEFERSSSAGVDAKRTSGMFVERRERRLRFDGATEGEG